MLMQIVETNAGNGDLLGSIENRLMQVLAHGYIALHVLDLNRRIVDQNSDGKSQATERHDVDGLPQRAENEQRGQNRERNRNADDQRASPTSEKTRIMREVRHAAMSASRPRRSREALTNID